MFTHIPNVFVSGVSGKTFLGWLFWAESKTMQLLFCCLCLRLLWWFWNWWNLGPKHFEFVIRFCVYKRRAWLVPDKLSKHNFDHTHPKPSRCWNTWTWTHCAFFSVVASIFCVLHVLLALVFLLVQDEFFGKWNWHETTYVFAWKPFFFIIGHEETFWAKHVSKMNWPCIILAPQNITKHDCIPCACTWRTFSEVP